MITIIDAGELQITGLPFAHRQAIQKKLSLTNPVYVRKIKLGTPMWGTQQFIEYYTYDKTTDTLYVPTGLRDSIVSFFKAQKLEHTYEKRKLAPYRTGELIDTIKLRDYQIPLLEALSKNDRGIIHLSTGGGKTVLALKCIALSPLKATIIVKDKNLLHQFKNECIDKLGITPSLIGDGYKDTGDITIATIQTLQSDDALLEQLASNTGLLIVDELHTMITEKRREVLRQFRPTRMYGLTATMQLSDESMQTPALQFVFGPVVGKHMIQTMKPVVNVLYTDAHIPVLAEYNKMIDLMIKHEARNKLIIGIAAAEIMSGGKVLILTKRVEHAELLYDRLKDMNGVYLIKQDTKEKSILLHDMKYGDTSFTCIIGTIALLGTGFDIPTLDRLFLVGDMKSNVLTTQTTGRILRILQGKEPVIYDFVDNKNGMLRAQYKSREKIYRENQWEITPYGRE